MRWLLLVLGVVLGGCAFGVPEPIEPGETYALGIEGPWTEDEVNELSAACADWGTWTKGRLACHLAGPGEDVDGTFVKTTIGNGDTVSKMKPFDREILFDPDAMRRTGYSESQYRGMYRWVLGRAARIPLHPTPGVMVGEQANGEWELYPTPEFTEDDRVSCRAAGFCE